VAPTDQQALTLLRSLPHGHVAAALGMLRKRGLDRVLSQGGRQPRRAVALCIAMIVARLIDPPPSWRSRGAVEELYAALDWLLGQQERIERTLARRHLQNGTLVLYDVTSTYFEGRTCPLAKLGYSRDGKRHKLQIGFAQCARRVPAVFTGGYECRGSRSRTGTLRWDRVRLPSEPGRGF
jgi:hypothetical protein